MNLALPISKRELRRTRLYLSASLKSDSGCCEVRLRDISSQGALVEGPAAPAVPSFVQLIWENSVHDARVAWVDGSWFGITFEQPLSGELLNHTDASMRVSAPRNYRRDSTEAEE